MKNTTWRLVETAVLDEGIDYDGTQLRSHFVRARGGIAGDGVVAFFGACEVSGEQLVDLEDREAGDRIVAKRMLHFIGEHFGAPLREVDWRLLLFAQILRDRIEELAPGVRLRRDGDDLFLGERKLTVAIATATPTSCVFHLGVNVDPAGAPVSAVGLAELGVDPPALARLVLGRYAAECERVEAAMRKVRGTS
ncbi:MAG: DUF366 family protein [Candidatus Krumholzibacteriota bacterium]|nr:DUF366 family protein [Candidatus Krumholzibacteriota bacterium]